MAGDGRRRVAGCLSVGLRSDLFRPLRAHHRHAVGPGVPRCRLRVPVARSGSSEILGYGLHRWIVFGRFLAGSHPRRAAARCGHQRTIVCRWLVGLAHPLHAAHRLESCGCIRAFGFDVAGDEGGGFAATPGQIHGVVAGRRHAGSYRGGQYRNLVPERRLFQ